MRTVLLVTRKMPMAMIKLTAIMMKAVENEEEVVLCVF